MIEPAQEPAPLFTEQEVQKIRKSLQETDPEVRWAAAQVLYSIQDPELGAMFEKLIAEDPDTDLRLKVVKLMKGSDKTTLLGALVKGLSDIDKDVRLAALHALGDIGDPSVATWVTACLKDPEPEVKIAALQTLGRFQEKRKADFKILANKLRKDYEEAVKKAAKRR